MKRSEINSAIADARMAFEKHQWHLPPEPRWDVTGFGMRDFNKYGLVLVNLAELPEYCEKLIYARHRQMTPLHTHRRKQEDIICRIGTFAIRLASRDDNWRPDRNGPPVRVLINGKERMIPSGAVVYMKAGERITLYPGVYHEFWPISEYAVIGEVSTVNDDEGDNLFELEDVGRFEHIDEDEPPLEKLLSDK